MGKRRDRSIATKEFYASADAPAEHPEFASLPVGVPATPRPGELPIAGHEPFQHRCDEFFRRDPRLPGLFAKCGGIANEIAVDGTRQLHCHPDRLVFDQRPEFQPSHQRFPSTTGARIKSCVTTMRSG